MGTHPHRQWHPQRGWFELDKQYPLPEDMTAEDFAALPEKSQDIVLWNVASQEIMKFNKAHPEFYRDPKGKNAKTINDFLVKQNLPITLRNLEYALNDLSDPSLPPDVRLETRPKQQPEQQQPAVTVRDPVPEARSEADEAVASLDKIVRDPNTSDAGRKAALKQLAVLAQADRVARRTPARPTFIY